MREMESDAAVPVATLPTFQPAGQIPDPHAKLEPTRQALGLVGPYQPLAPATRTSQVTIVRSVGGPCLSQ